MLASIYIISIRQLFFTIFHYAIYRWIRSPGFATLVLVRVESSFLLSQSLPLCLCVSVFLNYSASLFTSEKKLKNWRDLNRGLPCHSESSLSNRPRQPPTTEHLFMFTFILERNLSILEMALKKTSEGRSYQTLRHRSTCAEPSRIPLVMVAASTTQFDATGDTWADDGWTEPRYLTSISRHSSSCRRKGWTSNDCSCCWRRT